MTDGDEIEVEPGRVDTGRPTWSRPAEWPRCIAYRPNLERTVLTALVVGVVLFLINHLGPVLGGGADAALWVATGLSFLVPFCVSNIGLLVSSRRRDPSGHPGPMRALARAAPTWQRLPEGLHCIIYRPHLLRTVTVALVVGTVFFCVNQLDNVVGGHATTQVWVASAVTYLVPFSVSNVGVLLGCRRTDDPQDR